MRTKYLINRVPSQDFSQVTVFVVNRVHVWVKQDSVVCTHCQTPLCGMSGSCMHARAMKRYLKKLEAAK